MRSLSIHFLFGTTALMLVSYGQASFADDALTTRNKSIVPEFYTTVLINRDVDAAPRSCEERSECRNGDGANCWLL